MDKERKQDSELAEPSIGSILREGRLEENGISLNRFAKKYGIDSAYISRVENGEVPPSVNLIEAYVEEYNFARFYLYEKSGKLIVDWEALGTDNRELLQDWFNEGQIRLEK